MTRLSCPEIRRQANCTQQDRHVRRLRRRHHATAPRRLRARFRESFRQEKGLQPGEVCPLDLDLWSASIIFNQGHRLRVHVTSSSAPGFDPNPNTGAALRQKDATRAARNTVYCDAAHPSHLLLPVAAAPGKPGGG